jgi:hypothetical protein
MDSLFPDITLSKDDFINCNWDEVVNISDEKKCNKYYLGFWNKAQEAEQNGNTQLHITLTLLSGITSPALNSESTNKPFAYMDFIDKISSKHLVVLQDWIPYVTDAELKARVADVIWIRNRDYRMVQIAVDSYLESAKLLEHPKYWTSSVDRIERAIRLAYQANQKNHKHKVVTYIEDILDSYNGEDPLFFSAKLMELLQEFKLGNPSKYAPLAEKLAYSSEAEHNWHKARNYWQITIGWYRRNQNTSQERSASLSYAETYIKEAEDKINQTPPSYLAASRFFIKAIETLRNIGGNHKYIDEIHEKLLACQQESTTELQQFSRHLDVSDIANKAMEQVKDKQLHEAVYSLALMCKSPSVSDIRKQTEQIIEKSIFRDFFPPVMINEMGKVIGTSPTLEDEMYRNAIWYQNLQAQSVIEPARHQINLEHYVKVSDFYPLVVDNPFVPNGREEIYARGLHAGLTGDFIVATHLLIPQIEHSLRCLVKRKGAITSWLDKGIQDEYIMSVLFDKHEADLKSILGEDITFDLIGLLNRKGFGSNYRNLTSHGLISSNGFYTSRSVYLWWLTLHLCYLHIIPENNSTQINEQE